MGGVVVCHGSSAVRDRLVTAAHGVPGLAPVRSAASAEELLVLARRAAPTIVLLDAHLPGTGPVEAIRRLRMVADGTTVVMLAVPGDEVALDRAIHLGARGYLAPDVGVPELAAVVAHLTTGPVLHARVDGTAPAAPQPPRSPTSARAQVASMSAHSPRPVATETVLTKRELEVLTGMSNGRSNSQIGAELFLSEDTVKTHARRLFRKLGAADRAQAVAIGIRRGLIS
ncbi:response regulator transcription factor [Cellulomonas sp. P24]|nr:response regulator transcription factor [Cellulomonas sp. P24]